MKYDVLYEQWITYELNELVRFPYFVPANRKKNILLRIFYTCIKSFTIALEIHHYALKK